MHTKETAMITGERILAARLLEHAGEHYSNHGCNDTDDELLAGISEEDQQAMVERVKAWDGSPDLDHLTFRNVGDWMWMEYLASVVEDDADAAAHELLEALKAMRSFMWAEGYADQTAAMAQADAAIAKAEGL
jgi:hypothetical protein